MRAFDDIALGWRDSIVFRIVNLTGIVIQDFNFIANFAAINGLDTQVETPWLLGTESLDKPEQVYGFGGRRECSVNQ